MNRERGLVSRMKRWVETSFYSREERRHANVGPAKLWKMKQQFQIRFLKQHGLQPEHYFLDLGCGTLRGGIPIIDYLEKGHYFGIEVRAEVLEEGKKELQEANLVHKEPTLVATSDIGELGLEQSFDRIWAFAVLIHMTDDVLYDALDFVRRHLADDGLFYASANVGERPDKEMGRLGFPVVHRGLQFYEEACSRYGLHVRDMGPLTDFGHNLPDRTLEQQARQRMLEIQRA